MLIDANGEKYEGRAHRGDAGHDLRYAGDRITLDTGERALLATGLYVEEGALEGGAGFICPSSGLAHKHGISIVNAQGVVDAGYRGEIKVNVINLGEVEVTFNHGDRIAQFVPVRLLDDSWEGNGKERGEGGHGSSGR